MSECWPSHIPPRWRLSKEDIYAHLIAENQTIDQDNLVKTDLAEQTCEVLSQYIAMRDGVRLAVDIWLPLGHKQKPPLPAVVMFTRYWRAQSIGGERQRQAPNAEAAGQWCAAGYVYVVCDVRGSGASYGQRLSEYAEDEIVDYGEVVQWVSKQNWCDGFVATEGGSYSGNAAELSSVHKPDGLQAVIPRYTDFDSFQSIACPGGVPNLAVLQIWGAVTHALDRGLAEKLSGPISHPSQARGPMWVDEDVDRTQLQQAIAEHSDNFNVYDVALRTEYADDSVDGVSSRETTSLYRRGAQIVSAKVPQFAWASWMDAATADGLISRFLTFKDLPIRGVIGSWGHLGVNPGDPYSKQQAIAQQELIRSYADFLDEVRAKGAKGIEREIRYYTLNADQWQTTECWPPQGIEEQHWYFAKNHSLNDELVANVGGKDEYTVRNTTSGRSNRWHTQLGGASVDYGDRQTADKELLCYTSAVLKQALEITGHPIVDLFCIFDSEDAVVHAYLEDVAPNGEVRLITEGLLRAAHNTVSKDHAPYIAPGPARRFYKSDLCPLLPGEVTRVTFRMLPTSCLIASGHRLRLALAGRDVDTFAVYPDDGPQQWQVLWGYPSGSKLTLPANNVTT